MCTDLDIWDLIHTIVPEVTVNLVQNRDNFKREKRKIIILLILQRLDVSIKQEQVFSVLLKGFNVFFTWKRPQNEERSDITLEVMMLQSPKMILATHLFF